MTAKVIMPARQLNLVLPLAHEATDTRTTETTRRRTVRTALRRLETMPAGDVFTAGNSYLGLMGQAEHSHTDQARIARALMKRGHAVDGDLSRIFRSHS